MPDDDRELQIVALLTEVQLPLRLYVRSLLPGDPAASDVAQQANATLWRKRDAFELGTNFRAWAFRVARYEVLNYRKRQARDARLVFSERLEETFAEELAGPADDLAARHEALKQCLSNLRGKDRDLILHRYAGGGTLADYAARTGRSEGGLKVTLHRLRNALLACIRGQLQQKEEVT
ncbi:MAG: sigma-70 family RNA polymerase sigma factor [Opitutaceae bacterium]